MSPSGLRVAVVGATGAVGRTMLQLLRERDFPADELVLFASARSAGTEIDGRTVQLLDDAADISGFDIALFSAGGATSKTVGAALRRRRRDGDRQLLGLPPGPRYPARRL